MPRDKGFADTTPTDAVAPGPATYPARNIRKAMMLDALQDSSVLIPLTVCVLGIVYLLVLSPLWGGRGVASVLVLIAAGTAALNLSLSYLIDFDRKYSSKALELFPDLAAKPDSSASEISKLRSALKVGFADLGAEKGLSILNQLNQTFQGLQPVFERADATAAMTIERIPDLAEETYRQGLSILSDALELLAVTDEAAAERLSREIQQVEEDIESADRDESFPERLKLLEETLDSHRERLALVEKQGLTIEQLLHHAQTCETSLHRTRVELSALRVNPAKSSVREMTESLRETIVHAKDVQEEISRLGY